MPPAQSPAKRSAGAATYVALMRGINVGGNNKLPMKTLAALFAEEGCQDVRTYIQSGNVVFRATAAVARGISKRIGERIQTEHGMKTPVVLRTAAELAAVVRGNPFLLQGGETKPLSVLFLADAPSPEAVARLDAKRSPPDRFQVVGREVYLHCPNGLGETKLTNAYFDSALKTVSTSRNWNTVLKLVALSQGEPAPQ